ncbi:MAG: MFS transporter [Deltaproteobacteria bacterium]|nr:MFS transporter [Deltaproteobacteria bacterium]
MRTPSAETDRARPKVDPRLRPSVNDGMAYAVMAGAGESYINPFAIFLKASSSQVGLLTSLPPLIGALCQSLSLWTMEKFTSRRRLIALGAMAQALVWLPIAALPFLFDENSATAVNVLILLVALYHIAFQSTVPIWNSLIGDLVPIETRGSFFGFRNRRTGLLTFTSLLVAGQILHLFESQRLTTIGFCMIFLIAFLARSLSSYWITRYPDPPYNFEASHRFSFWDFIRRSPRSNFAKFVYFVASMNLATYVAGPYFALYMLNDLKMSYSEYTVVIASATVSQFLTMHYWGTLSDQFGNRKIMTVCGIGIAVVPFLWIVWSNTLAIILMQAFSGFMWAGFNLSASNFMFDAVSPPKRARCVAYQSIVNASFIMFGSLLGAFLVENLPADWPLASGIWAPSSGFLRIFAISGILRLAVLAVLLKMFKEVREVEQIRHRDLIFRITNFRPLSGASFGLITAALKRKKDRHPPS